MTLGELLAKLLALSTMGYGTKRVHYDFGYFVPTELGSYRGYYEQIALGYAAIDDRPEEKRLDVTDMIELVRSAIGADFEGYKGGEYTMGDETPVWIANYGEGCFTALHDVTLESLYVILHTRYRDW